MRVWLEVWNNCVESGNEKSLQLQKLIQIPIMLKTLLILNKLVNEENVSPCSEFFIHIN